MESITENRKQAVKNIQKANYMLGTTYPLLREPKTLLSVSNHALASFLSSVTALLLFERSQKLIPPFHENDESKINAFRQHVVAKHKLYEYAAVIERIRNLSQQHKKASIEFTRDNKFIICSDQFQKIETLSQEDAQNYIQKAKDFLKKVEDIISNE